MTERRGIHPLVAIWIVLLFVSLVILLHQEIVPLGPHSGWQLATLHSDEYLFGWTRKRLVIWFVLYVAGAGLLRIALRRDPGGQELRLFAGTRPGRAAIPFAVTVFLMGMVFLPPAEILLVAMGVGVIFFGVWGLAPTGVVLARMASRLMLFAASLLALIVVGEALLRLPGVVASTGGSYAHRSRMFDRLHEMPEVAQRSELVWRTKHVAGQGGSDVATIFALGDSFTWGQWVPGSEDVWPHALEDDLTAEGRAVRVVNAGVNGTSTNDQANRLEMHGWAFEPDLVILQYTLNDSGGHFDSVPLLPVLSASLERTSCLYSYLNGRFKALQAGWLGPTSFAPFFADSFPGWQQSRAAVERIREQTQRRGVPMLFVLFPMFDSRLDEAGYRHIEAHRSIAAYVREAGIPFLDLRESLARIDADPRSWWAQPFDAHPNEEAHRVAARDIAAEIQRRRWLGN